ncbi:hypothetical protein T484DRAFT_1854193 [Baffinella frigidus]|nr:hypothetical protein T484DRAFT_1854193 [Cryptophyta sp. CCMP2293]
MHRSIVFLPALLLLASSADAFLGVAQRPALRSVVAPRAAACASSRASMSAEPRDSRRALLQQVGSAAAAVVLAPLSARAEDVMSPADLPALESGVTESGVKYDIVGFVEIAGKEDAVIVQMLAKKKSTGEVIMDTKTDGKGFLIKMGKPGYLPLT